MNFPPCSTTGTPRPLPSNQNNDSKYLPQEESQSMGGVVSEAAE